MKRIIGGKRYDTATAEEVSEVGSRGTSKVDAGYWKATLYRTPRGRWFLKGTGGPMTMFSQPYGNASSGGSGLIPVSATDARHFLEVGLWPDGGNMDALERWFAIEEA